MAAIEQTTRPMIGEIRATTVGKAKLALPVVLYLAAVMLPIGFYVGPLYLNLVRLVLLVMIVPLTLKFLAGRYGGILIPDVFFFLYVLWMIISIAVNDPDRLIESVGSTTVEFIGSYILARAYIRTEGDFVALIRAFVVMIVLTAPVSFYELITNHSLILETLQRIPGVKTEWIVPLEYKARSGLFRVQGGFPHPIHYGVFCSICFMLCIEGLKGYYEPFKRYASATIIVFCTFSSLSSGALLSVFLQTGLIAWAYIFKKIETRWIILITLFIIAYIVVDLLSNRTPILVFLSYATFDKSTAYYRSYIFEYGMQNVWANPWLGLGTTRDWVRPDWMHANTVDNFWLLRAMRYGFPGALLLIIGYITQIWSIARKKFRKETDIWRLRRAWVIVFIGLTFSLMTVDVWSTLFSFVFFMFGAGMWFLTVSPEDGKDASPTETSVRQKTKLPLHFNPIFEGHPLLQQGRASTSPQQTRSEEQAEPRETGTWPRYSRFPQKTRTTIPSE